MKIPLSLILMGMLLAATGPGNADTTTTVERWSVAEVSFASDRVYGNPLYDVAYFRVTFTSPTGRGKTVNGFWDGGADWNVRFQPGETGTWTWKSACSDKNNAGLHGQSGSFECIPNTSGLDIYRRGSIVHPVGAYHLTHADGTPFFFCADTAWNGALRSTVEEWETYLANRTEIGFNTIQFVTTQWRGGDADIARETAFEGSGRITLNPAFFQRLDTKVDRINAHGLVAAPVVLWALQTGTGRELSPGYHLPLDEAVKLAKYIVARYGAHHVIWFIGGDGRFVDEYEQRWKEIGRRVFSDGFHQGLVTLHPQGRSWIGTAYRDERWLDIVGYQSSHSTAKRTVEFITQGPPANEWAALPPRPIINLEPIYENILADGTTRDVRNACWWSVLVSPTAGISYGANGIWPWLRTGEKILNHRDAPHTKPWHESIHFPGGRQTGYIRAFMELFEWWTLRPAQDLLRTQPGSGDYRAFIAVSQSGDRSTIVVYSPKPGEIELYNPDGYEYVAQWFDPAEGTYAPGRIDTENGIIRVTHAADTDMVLLLKHK